MIFFLQKIPKNHGFRKFQSCRPYLKHSVTSKQSPNIFSLLHAKRNSFIIKRICLFNIHFPSLYAHPYTLISVNKHSRKLFFPDGDDRNKGDSWIIPRVFSCWRRKRRKKQSLREIHFIFFFSFHSHFISFTFSFPSLFLVPSH